MKDNSADKDTTQIGSAGSSAGKVPRRYRASVVIVKGYAEGMEYPISAEYTVLGRDKTAGIILKDPLISRQHAAILFHDGEFRLKDLGSTNGTIMNGSLIEVTEVRHRDKFRIGNTTLQFILEDTKESDTFEISDETY